MTHRFVALGDSFTEGVGDNDPGSPNAVRGWADRTAEQLAHHEPDMAYANLAIRGRLLPQVLAEQLEPALAMQPDLVTLFAGANDLMRPKVDIDALAESYDQAVAELTAAGATVLLFTGGDRTNDRLLRQLRGRTAIYNEYVRLISARHHTLLVDMWAMPILRDRRLFAPDRIHLNSSGHTVVAAAVCDALNITHTIRLPELAPRGTPTHWQQGMANLRWAREHAVPWVGRRIRGRSSGDAITAKRPTPVPVVPTGIERTR